MDFVTKWEKFVQHAKKKQICTKKMSNYSPSTIQNLLSQHYRLEGELTPLAGEIDRNYRLQTPDNQSYLVKITPPNSTSAPIALQNAALLYLQKQNCPVQISQLIPTIHQEFNIKINADSLLRVFSWVEGRLWVTVQPKSSELLFQLGTAIAQISKSFQGFDHPDAHRFYRWNPTEAAWIRPHLTVFESVEKQSLVSYWLNFFEAYLPKIKECPKAVNYLDANDYNIIVSTDPFFPTLQGFIDFGDLLYTEQVNDLAIAITYAIMDFPDPVEAATQIIKGYQKVLPLEEREVEVLFPLIIGRLLISVTISTINAKEQSDNDYLQVSSRPAWKLLQQFRKLAPSFVHYRFREACGLEPCPQHQPIVDWLKNKQDKIQPILPLPTEEMIVKFDLSVGSLDLGNNINFENIDRFDALIQNILLQNSAELGVGGYGELRPFYTTDAYLSKGNKGPQWRTLHLGVDLWASAQTPVFAPLDGKLFAKQNNAQERDYGPTLILEHQTEDGLPFYSLYGHLSPESLDLAPDIGKVVEAGQQIGWIGNRPDNGNWPPHLHFQVISDLLGNTGDFPGVAFPHESKTWQSICPDPNLILGLEKLSTNPAKSTKADILNLRKQHLAPNLSISYQKPLHIVRGFKQYLYANNGRRYLDTVNNVPHVGHQHPKVVEVAQRQLAVLNTNTRYLHQQIVEYAHNLLAKFPKPLEVVFFVNSGSEANELALRLARTYTKQQDILVLEAGYHGNTSGTVAMSSYKFDGKGGDGALPGVHVLPMPDLFRGTFREDTPQAASKYAAFAEKAIDQLRSLGKAPAAFIHESILSCGGQIVLPKGYLKKVYGTVRKAGGICIADEVQVGFGRIGHHYWGFELQNVVPDIVTLGKPMGNGHPIGAVVTTRAIADAFNNGMEFFSTFGGNPVSCAIGQAVLSVIEEEQLQSHALQVGNYLKSELEKLSTTFPIIGEVRGHGLFLGFELVSGGTERIPAPLQTSYLANRMRERGILMSTDGPQHNVIKIKPPMCFIQKNADFLIEQLAVVLKEDAMQL